MISRNNPEKQTGSVPLSDISAGCSVRLVAVDAGCGLNSRLVAMGLLPNCQITVLRNEGRGQLIIKARNSKMVLGRGMADKILVK